MKIEVNAEAMVVLCVLALAIPLGIHVARDRDPPKHQEPSPIVCHAVTPIQVSTNHVTR